MEWITDNNETVVEFAVKNFWGLASVKGRMQIREGRLELADSEANQGSAYVEIDTTSINSGNTRRDKHLKTTDFFEVERYPLITFRGRNVEQVYATNFRLKGDLTVRDVTRPITLEVSRQATPGDAHIYFQVSTILLRHDFGLTNSKFPIGREVTINLKVKAVQSSQIVGKPGPKS